MKVSEIIGLKMHHTTAPEITAEVTDTLFAFSLNEAAFFLADVTTPDGTAPVLFSPSVLVLEDDILMISAHPDDVKSRVNASIHRTKVPVDPAEFPSTFIGPFGNTFSPSMIAALFNARTSVEQTVPPVDDGDGVWFSELRQAGVLAHVATVGRISDIILDDHFHNCEAIEFQTPDGAVQTVAPVAINASRSPSKEVLVSLVQPDGPVQR